jgi:hypothetical protein
LVDRCLPTDPQLPGFEAADLGQLAADMARSAWLRVHGDFILARGNAEAGLLDMTDDAVERWTLWFEVDTRVR